jgi:DNA-binding transcriptional MerR regulator
MKLSIANLEQLSGVPVHTIRIWERRYHALNPSRTNGNTRFYTDDDVKRLLDIVSLNQSGVKISKACSLSGAEIDEMLTKELNSTISLNANFEFYISQLLKFGLAYDEFHFSGLLSDCIDQHGVTDAYQQVIYPLLQRIGLMWRRDHICPAQEHFLSAIIRQKLMAIINTIPLQHQQRATWLLFLPEDEAHDIPLLFASYLLRSNGYKVIYLGERVPFDSLKDVVANNKIENMLFFMVRQRPVAEANTYLQALLSAFPCNLYLAGNGRLIESLDLDSRISWFKSITEFQKLIQIRTNAN